MNVSQRGNESLPNNRQVIVIGSYFSCNGIITGYLISLQLGDTSGCYPSVQIWRRSGMNSPAYERVGTLCALTDNDVTKLSDDMGEYYLGNVSCIGDSRFEVQPGDIIGYHQGDPSCYRLWSIDATGYTSYYRDRSSGPLDTFNTNPNNVMKIENRRPLIQVKFGNMIIFIAIALVI